MGASRAFSYLRLQQGQPTIWERFLANVAEAGLQEMVLPLRLTSIVGLRLTQRLVASGRLRRGPQVVYLDSAHEYGETLLELAVAWDTVDARRGAIIYGDDWAWDPVRHNVMRFASCLSEASTNMVTSDQRRLSRETLLQTAFLRHLPSGTAGSLERLESFRQCQRVVTAQGGGLLLPQGSADHGRFCTADGLSVLLWHGQWVLFREAHHRSVAEMAVPTRPGCSFLTDRL